MPSEFNPAEHRSLGHGSSEGTRVMIDGAEKGVLPGGVPVEAGEHQLALEEVGTGRVLYAGRLSATQGLRVDVSELIPPRRRLQASVELRAMALVGGAARAALPGPSGQLRAGVRGLDWPWPKTALGARASLLLGGGTLPGFSEGLPYVLLGARLEVAGARYWRVTGRDVELGLAPGLWWVRRAIDHGTFRGGQAVLGGTVCAEASASRRVGPVELGAKLGGGLLFASLLQSIGPHGVIEATALLRF